MLLVNFIEHYIVMQYMLYIAVLIADYNDYGWVGPCMATGLACD